MMCFKKTLSLTLAMAIVLALSAMPVPSTAETTTINGLGLTEKDVIDSYLYIERSGWLKNHS